MRIPIRSLLRAPVIIGGLGYFVDIFDLVLFSVVRTSSLRQLGLGETELLSAGVRLLNCQMTGLLLGGFLWGVLGDKRGRRSVLFGSILLYSVANLANAFVDDLNTYMVLRFLAGVGLAGELGAAITLVSESLSKENRGYGTAFVAGIGLSGAVAAGFVGELLSWRMAYAAGGTLGLFLLFLRVGLAESGLFHTMKARTDVRRGDLRMLFGSKKRVVRFLSCIGIAVPVWYVVGILVTFSPEICAALGATGPVSAGRAILWCYVGVSLGDFGSGFWSQWRGSRKKVVRDMLLALAVCTIGFVLLRHSAPHWYYFVFFLLGATTGYWAVFMTMTAEQFGTNLRATVTTSVPNLVRGSVILLASSFAFARPSLGVIGAAIAVGVVAIGLAFLSLRQLDETHARDLAFEES